MRSLAGVSCATGSCRVISATPAAVFGIAVANRQGRLWRSSLHHVCPPSPLTGAGGEFRPARSGSFDPGRENLPEARSMLEQILEYGGSCHDRQAREGPPIEPTTAARWTCFCVSTPTTPCSAQGHSISVMSVVSSIGERGVTLSPAGGQHGRVDALSGLTRLPSSHPGPSDSGYFTPSRRVDRSTPREPVGHSCAGVRALQPGPPHPG